MLEARPGLRVTVLEQERELAVHQSGHNSGVIHAGLYYPPGPLKAALCREGKAALESFCEQHDIPFQRVGKLVIAVTDDELPRLEELHQRAAANQVPGARHRASCRSVATTTPSRRRRGTWCAGSFIRCPIRISHSWACISRGGSTVRCGQARTRSWPSRAGATGDAMSRYRISLAR